MSGNVWQSGWVGLAMVIGAGVAAILSIPVSMLPGPYGLLPFALAALLGAMGAIRCVSGVRSPERRRRVYGWVGLGLCSLVGVVMMVVVVVVLLMAAR